MSWAVQPAGVSAGHGRVEARRASQALGMLPRPFGGGRKRPVCFWVNPVRMYHGCFFFVFLFLSGASRLRMGRMLDYPVSGSGMLDFCVGRYTSVLAPFCDPPSVPPFLPPFSVHPSWGLFHRAPGRAHAIQHDEQPDWVSAVAGAGEGLETFVTGCYDGCLRVYGPGCKVSRVFPSSTPLSFPAG